jgi:subtilisin family serine protease
MATPHVTGAVACYLSRFSTPPTQKEPTPADVKNILLSMGQHTGRISGTNRLSPTTSLSLWLSNGILNPQIPIK